MKNSFKCPGCQKIFFIVNTKVWQVVAAPYCSEKCRHDALLRDRLAHSLATQVMAAEAPDFVPPPAPPWPPKRNMEVVDPPFVSTQPEPPKSPPRRSPKPTGPPAPPAPRVEPPPPPKAELSAASAAERFAAAQDRAAEEARQAYFIKRGLPVPPVGK
jgi:hypothetical protein